MMSEGCDWLIAVLVHRKRQPNQPTDATSCYTDVNVQLISCETPSPDANSCIINSRSLGIYKNTTLCVGINKYKVNIDRLEDIG